MVCQSVEKQEQRNASIVIIVISFSTFPLKGGTIESLSADFYVTKSTISLLYKTESMCYFGLRKKFFLLSTIY